MSKYSEGLAGQTVPYIEDDSYSISEICEMLNISRKTFYEWRDAKPESGKAIKEAKRYCLKSVTFVTFLNKSPSNLPKGRLFPLFWRGRGRCRQLTGKVLPLLLFYPLNFVI